MKTLATRRVVHGLLAATLVMLLLAGVAEAQARAKTTLKVLPLAEGAVGQEMDVSAALTDQSGAVVPGAEIVFHRDARFLNSTSELEIGRAITNEQGVATVRFLPRSEGEILVIADFAGDTRYGSSSHTVTVQIATGGPLYSQEQGVKVPGINVSLLVAILGAVWATYFAVMAHIFLIARRHSPEGRPEVSRE